MQAHFFSWQKSHGVSDFKLPGSQKIMLKLEIQTIRVKSKMISV